MRKLRILLVLVLVFALIPAGTALAKKPAGGETTHSFDGTPGTGAYDGFLQAWVGEIDVDGDEDGDYDIVWWIKLGENWRETGKASHYWMVTEIWDGDTKILATWEHGTTTSPNTSWRANGVVTYATDYFDGWEGRRVHESGNFWVDPIDGLVGESIFRLN
jgi:hypothetical protein